MQKKNCDFTFIKKMKYCHGFDFVVQRQSKILGVESVTNEHILYRINEKKIVMILQYFH